MHSEWIGWPGHSHDLQNLCSSCAALRTMVQHMPLVFVYIHVSVTVFEFVSDIYGGERLTLFMVFVKRPQVIFIALNIELLNFT